MSMRAASQTAGVPPVSEMRRMPWGALLGGIQPVTRPWTDHRQPPFEIQWNRVYTLPDFVRFTHKPHIGPGFNARNVTAM